MAIFICPFTWFYLHCQQPYSYSRQGEMKTGRLIPISSYILIILLNFQAPRNIVRRELHKIFKQGQDAELTWVWLQQNFQFCAIWESGTKSTRDNGRTCNFNCLPFMSWSAPQLSSFLLPSPEMLTSVSDLFTHILCIWSLPLTFSRGHWKGREKWILFQVSKIQIQEQHKQCWLSMAKACSKAYSCIYLLKLWGFWHSGTEPTSVWHRGLGALV